MDLTASELADMRYLRQRYQWTDADAREVMAAIREGGASLVHYFVTLATAHRAGYEQDAGNGFVRLKDWCEARGLPNPYLHGIDPAALDATASPARRAA